MTRGKYKDSAEARQARESAITRGDRLQREVDRLTRANTALAIQAEALATSHAVALADLREQLEAATSTTVRAQADQIAALRTEIEARDFAWEKAQVAYQCTSDALAKAYEASGMGLADARERALNDGVYALHGGIVERVGEVTITVDTAGVRASNLGRIPTEKEKAALRAVQRAKGLRK